jgi:hypothetical protein
MESLKFQKKKGIKVTLTGLKAEEETIFPRDKYSSVRNSMSTLKIEHPEREYVLEIIENGIRVICLK